MGATKIPRKSPFNSKKLQKNAPIGKKWAVFFSQKKKAENGLMVGAMKSAHFFLMGVLKKKEGICPFFGNRYFGPLLPT